MVKLDGSGKELNIKPENVALQDEALSPEVAGTAAALPAATEQDFTCAVCYEEYTQGEKQWAWHAETN